MNRNKLVLYATLGLVVILGIVVVAMNSTVPKAATAVNQKATLAVGGKAPEFSVNTTAGPFALSGVSTPVLLEVFATWCPHCQHETEVLNKLSSQYRGKLAVVAVSGSPYAIDGSTGASLEDVQLFGQHFNVAYPLAYDSSLDVANKYIQGGFPTLVLIDRKKTVAWFKDGEVPIDEIEKQINALTKS